MRKLLVSTTALSVAISPLATVPSFGQVMNEDGSVSGPDGAVLCVPTADAACDLDAIIAQLKADAAAAAAAQAEADAAAAAAAQAEADAAKAAEEQAAAEAAAQAEADAKAQAEADAAAAAEAAAAVEAEAKAQAEADAAAAAQAEAEAQAQADAAAAKAAEEQAAAEAAAQAEADAAAEAAAQEAAPAEEPATEDAAPAEEPVVDEAPAEEPAVESAPAEEPVVNEAPAEEPAVEEAAPAEEPAVEPAPAEEPVAEEPAAVEEPTAQEPAAEPAAEPATEEPAAEPAAEPTGEAVAPDAIIDSATGEVVDPAVAAAAVAAAEAELVAPSGEIVDPAAGLKVAEPDPAVVAEPVEAPVVSETEVEGLTQLLTADPTAIDPSSLGAAALVSAPPSEDAKEIAKADPASLVADVTETLTADNTRSSAQEFAAAPKALAGGKKSGLSDLEKAGLLVLGALAVGAIIKNNREAAATDTTVSTMGDSRVVSNTGDRVIVLQPDGTYRVLKDDDTVIRRPGSTVRTETFKDGSTRTIVQRGDGTQVVTIRDATGRVLRRATYDDMGREIVLIDDLATEDPVYVRDLPKPKKRIVISSKDDDAALKRELAALEADSAGRKFSLRQIREIPEVRALAATIDVEPVKFASGSAAVGAKEARNLADLGRVMQQLLDDNPREVFLIEGHTDATGKAAMNLALSDRRAESVALALTEYFDIPPENMVVQGYGETELLIDTQESEAANRRVEVRVITPLLRTKTRG
ncbi:OmpA family protein [Tabrizicola sp.]|uniref:OmpA family protein n=1 Tax=Tabrizicola sp. TaxID=2005166 RepID=UPI0035B0282D